MKKSLLKVGGSDGVSSGKIKAETIVIEKQDEKLTATSKFSRPIIHKNTNSNANNNDSLLADIIKSNSNISASSSTSNGSKTDLIDKIIIEEELAEARICKQLLTSGYIQSYVDFYHLTNRADPSSIEGLKVLKIRTSVATMTYICENLIAAEGARRLGDTNGVYTAYNRLADMYASCNDWKTSIFFHEKGLEVATLTSDDRAMMSANHCMGIVYQKMGDFHSALKFHEKHEEIALTYDVLEEVSKCNTELFKVYMKIAIQFEENNSYDDALNMYKKCLQAAKKSWNRADEGRTNGKIGTLLLNKGNTIESLPYLRQESQIAADRSDSEGRCRASSALALAFDVLGQTEKALEELKLVHAISEQAGDANLQAQACKALGTLYSKLGKLDHAFESLSKHFSLVKSLLSNRNKAAATTTTGVHDGTMKVDDKFVITAADLELARVYVGIGKGNLLMGAYVVCVQSDLSSLIDWKLNRSELQSSNIDEAAAVDEGVVESKDDSVTTAATDSDNATAAATAADAVGAQKVSEEGKRSDESSVAAIAAEIVNAIVVAAINSVAIDGLEASTAVLADAGVAVAAAVMA